ncbi:hydrolase [Vibrio sp. 10N.286.49.B3]|uniref:C40 family peptidase n=1 Tax=Vibrio sp. 10N.286.49.B3 TaxID=1880855 RepID=UPI000C859C9A|nr:NlpC/P60 family protein [Vibrio sp. 10N.286.49.B3]PMH44930.1 hydrolase [Vibrio sp. 10N.286.49.B3]
MTYKFLIISSILMFSGCASPPPESKVKPKPPAYTAQSSLDLKLQLMTEYKKWHGTPYKFGGNSFKGVDCSAFIQSVFLNSQQLLLPRTTAQQSKIGTRVKHTDLKIGDLIFFKTSKSARHVGIYLGNKQFMHASSSKGVIISRIDNPYWASVFWQYRRILI